jgi:hypothetical protein
MNDFELESKLKSVPAPERPESYWEDFPSRVRVQLRRGTLGPEARETRRPQFAWKMGLGFACLILVLPLLGQPLKAASCAIFKNEQSIGKKLVQLPGHLRVFMQDEHGMDYLVAGQE